MYFSHQNNKLQELFSRKAYQGADPASAKFLFFGLDANYEPDIENKRYFPEIVSYLEDGVQYWKERGVHHPFRLPEYKGDGKLYHNRFAEIGFTKEQADQVSFVELIDVPTYGKSKLKAGDLNVTHLDRLLHWVQHGNAAHIFIPPGVLRLLKKTPQFFWLPDCPLSTEGSLPVLYRTSQKCVYAPFHFSCIGRNCLKKYRDLQIKEISNLINADLIG